MMEDSGELKAVICAAQRSGTTAFHSVLRKNNVFCPGEIFHPGRNQTDSFFYYLKNIRKLSYLDIVTNNTECWTNYLSYLEELAGEKDMVLDIKYNSWHHFNSSWHQPVHPPRLLGLLPRTTWIIHIIRRNIFAQVLSGEVAQKRGQFHNNTDEDLSSMKFAVDVERFSKKYELIEESTEKYCEWLEDRKNVMTFYYEDLFSDNCVTPEISSKLSEMGIDLTDIQTNLRKPKSDYSVMVTNYDELASLFAAVA